MNNNVLSLEDISLIKGFMAREGKKVSYRLVKVTKDFLSLQGPKGVVGLRRRGDSATGFGVISQEGVIIDDPLKPLSELYTAERFKEEGVTIKTPISIKAIIKDGNEK